MEKSSANGFGVYETINMKKLNAKILVALCFIFSIGIYSQNRGVANQPISKLPAKEKRWALIIGVDTYQKDISPLYGTVNDAKALRDVLIKYAGFTNERIILMTTDSNDSDLIPTKGNIIDQLEKLSRVVPEDGLILFSFSGHGVSIGSDAFIVPADGRIYQSADYMRERAIDVLRIKRAIQNTKVKQVIMFLDACRNNPVRAKGDVDNNLTPAYAKGFSFETRNQNIEAYATLYATSFGDRAYEFLNKKTNKYRGYFSYAIEEGFKGSAANEKGEVTLGSLIRYIGDTVKERVRINENQRQIPYLDIGGSFTYSDLVIAVAERNTLITRNLPDVKDGEQAYWQEIERTNTISGYENFLARYPKGEYSNLAKLRLGKLKWEQIKPIAKLLTNYALTDIFTEGTAKILKSKEGFINEQGIEIILPKYYDIQHFSEGLVGVKSEGKWGFVNRSGEEIIPLIYDDVKMFSDDLAAVKFMDKWGFIDRSGKLVIPYKYTDASSFSQGLAKVTLYERTGFINRFGREVIPLKYWKALSFSEGLAAVYDIPKIYFINTYGMEILKVKYNNVGPFSEDLAAFQFQKKWGFIDKSGREVISARFDDVKFFSNGLAPVKISDKWGIIDKLGNEIVPPIYDQIINAKKPETKKIEDNLSGYTSRPFPASYLTFTEELIIIVKNGKLGVLDLEGKLVVPVKYDGFWCSTLSQDGFIGVTLNGKRGFVDIYGNEYFDF